MVGKIFHIGSFTGKENGNSTSNGFKTFFGRLVQRKSINQLQAEAENNNELKRTLGSFQLLALGVGGIIGKFKQQQKKLKEYLKKQMNIGTGIFVLSGEAAAKYAGPSVIISFILAAIVAGLAAFSYAEMASMVPISGSAYSYTYASMFEIFYFLINKSLIYLFYLAMGGKRNYK